ncbi:MAG: DnaJ domain-containing protein [Desulfobacterales bacterium]
MASKNYYLILGISPSASAESVRTAFRRLAKKCHPDKVGENQTAAFQDIAEAYEVLSDPEKRKHYNNKLIKEKNRNISPARGARNSSFHATRPQMQDFEASSYARNGFDNIAPGRTDSSTIEMDAYLTLREAISGTTIRLNITFGAICRFCGGTGYDFIFGCPRCKGSGRIASKKPIEIQLPSNLNHGSQINTTIELSKENYLHLLIHVHII